MVRCGGQGVINSLLSRGKYIGFAPPPCPRGCPPLPGACPAGLRPRHVQSRR